jgi:aryl sulfotransferase
MRPQLRTYISATTDSTRWSAYAHRPGDIFVCTPPKCGTTWMQTIVTSLLWPDGNFPGVVMQVAPWFDGAFYNFDEVLARLEAQTHRRHIKTHTPADGIPIFDTASYIVVARDGRDAFMSFANHIAKMSSELRVQRNAAATARGLDPLMEFNGDIHEFFDNWIAAAPTMRHIATWWNLRDQPNVLLVHYNDLKAGLTNEMRRVAEFLEIDVPAALWPDTVQRCTFDHMRADAAKIGNFDRIVEGGAQSFLFKGTNDRWQGVLTEDELERYQVRVFELLPPEAAQWLEHGSRGQESAERK